MNRARTDLEGAGFPGHLQILRDRRLSRLRCAMAGLRILDHGEAEGTDLKDLPPAGRA